MASLDTSTRITPGDYKPLKLIHDMDERKNMLPRHVMNKLREKGLITFLGGDEVSAVGDRHLFHVGWHLTPLGHVALWAYETNQ